MDGRIKNGGGGRKRAGEISPRVEKTSLYFTFQPFFFFVSLIHQGDDAVALKKPLHQLLKTIRDARVLIVSCLLINNTSISMQYCLN